ncbi:MAG: hypothetical protein LBH35_04070 [Treponema sp.]|nr:hypothetical protein [Treponema sp.]
MSRGGFSEGWKETTYREALERELRGLERRLESDPRCGAEELEAVLRHLYVMLGSDWGGRGEVQNLCLEAAVAAYEETIARLKNSQALKTPADVFGASRL